jgi:hypothetical protein
MTRHPETPDPIVEDRDPTPAEVYEDTRRYVASVRAETGGDGRKHDTHWARGARYVMERADAYIAELRAEIDRLAKP